MTQQPIPLDTTYYPVDDGMAENSFELGNRVLLLPLVRRFLAHRGQHPWVGSNQFLYWRQFDPSCAVAPDLYVVPGLPPDAEPPALKLWELGPRGTPSFALEIVSRDTKKDYQDSPRRYQHLGVRELVIYHHDFAPRRREFRFQVYRRGPRGRLLRVVTSNDDRVESQVLGCHLREVQTPTSPRLRIGVGPHGDELFPTDTEAAEAERDTVRAERDAV